MDAKMLKKNYNMILKDILWNYTDKDHKLKRTEIMKLVKEKYGVEAEAKDMSPHSIDANIKALQEMFDESDIEIYNSYYKYDKDKMKDLDSMKDKDAKKEFIDAAIEDDKIREAECMRKYGIPMDDGEGVAITARTFEESELRMLIDAVLFAKFIPHSHAVDLIDKIKKQGSRFFRDKVKYTKDILDSRQQRNTINQQILFNLEEINNAINNKTKVSFIYNDYGLDYKLHPRRENYTYIVNPYYIALQNGAYYLLANVDAYDNLAYFRIDRMTDVKEADEARKDKKQIVDFPKLSDLSKYMEKRIYMINGATPTVTFICHKSLLNELVDWFGNGFGFKKLPDDMLEIDVECSEQAMLYWALQYGDSIEVLQPLSLREKIKEEIQKMVEKYK